MTLWRGKDPLILASQSHARQTLLANAGISFEVVPADIDERAVQKTSGLASPGDIAALLAREKALAASARQPGKFVVGADQTLALGERLFSKPAGRPQAAEQLRELAGQSHELHSAVALARDGKILFADVVVARVAMRRLSERLRETPGTFAEPILPLNYRAQSPRWYRRPPAYPPPPAIRRRPGPLRPSSHGPVRS